ncbi:MAG: hypothetical protein Q7P63_14940 [Verrucomicrobiota bacterium JB022]|nr:hypothetical protein [Verrucomicrobiota bacterium JB022]
MVQLTEDPNTGKLQGYYTNITINSFLNEEATPLESDNPKVRRYESRWEERKDVWVHGILTIEEDPQSSGRYLLAWTVQGKTSPAHRGIAKKDGNTYWGGYIPVKG